MVRALNRASQVAERDTMVAEERRGRAAVGAELAAVRAQAKQAAEAEAVRNSSMAERDAQRQVRRLRGVSAVRFTCPRSRSSVSPCSSGRGRGT